MDRRSALLVLGALGAALAGCAPDVPATPSPTPTPTPEPGPRWPLTGRPLDDPAAAAHAAIAVKVPDNRNEHPQAGLNDADIVFVQLEGYADASGESATRLVPVFHSVLPERVAPVRSVRPVDVPLLAPMRAVVGSTGHSDWVGNYARQFADHLDVSLTNLAARKRGADVSTLGGAPATRVRVPWKKRGEYAMTYDWDAGQGVYLRSVPWGPHVLAGGQQVTTDNVLVIKAGQRVAKLAEGSGAPDPIHDIIDASGVFLYAHAGSVVRGTWAKAAVELPFTFTLDSGAPLAMAPGRTFVELPATDADVQVS